jgi:hypothetical protein
MKNTTLVTGLWNIGRGNLTEGWSRSFDTYLEKFKDLLQYDGNLIIFGDQEVIEYAKTFRNEDNTQFIVRSVDWFKNNEY